MTHPLLLELYAKFR